MTCSKIKRLALAALAATAIGPSLITAHMAMVTPAPFATPKVGPQNNSPLAADGTDFPCKAGPSDTYVPGTTPNNFPLGSEQPLVFVGSAVHGGGSCQISITYDNPPTAKSVWKVVTSIEGGCPARGEVGNLNIAGGASAPDPYTYNFTIPDNIPTGKATLAWTWFGKLGGRPEMYMNCAPVTLTAPGEASANGSSLTPRDDSGPMAVFESLPDMFVANIGNGCKSPESADTLFPNPGANLQQLNGDTTKFSTPIGTGCQQPTGSPPESPSSNNASSSAAITTSNSQSTSPSSSSTNVLPSVTPFITASNTASTTTSSIAADNSETSGSVTSSSSSSSSETSGGTVIWPGDQNQPEKGPYANSSTTLPIGISTNGTINNNSGQVNCFASNGFVPTNANCDPSGSGTLDTNSLDPDAGPVTVTVVVSSGTTTSIITVDTDGAIIGGPDTETSTTDTATVTATSDPATGTATVDASSVSSNTGSVTSSSAPISSTTLPSVTITSSASISSIVGAASTASSTDDSDTSSSTDSSITGAELMGACSDEGVYNCIDGDSYQTCSSGTWSIALYMDEGESCKVGQYATLQKSNEVQPARMSKRKVLATRATANDYSSLIPFLVGMLVFILLLSLRIRRFPRARQRLLALAQQQRDRGIRCG